VKLYVLVSAFCLLTSFGFADDVGIDTITRPNGTIDSGETVVPTCVVHAYTSSGPVDVHFLIPEAGYRDSLTLPPLPPGLIDSATFTPWTPIGRDSMTALAWLHCAGDTNPLNDTFRVRFLVRVSEIEFELMEPQDGDTLDSGTVVTPRCRIWNLSNQSLNFDVRFRLFFVDTAIHPTGYVFTRNLNLIAGGSTLVSGPPFTTMPGEWLLTVDAGEAFADSAWFWVRGGAGIEEMPSAECRMSNVGPTVLSGSMVHSLSSKVVFDALGRRVLNPKSGVCFVAEYGERSTVHVRKVIIQN